jgi:hypothetical protein
MPQKISIDCAHCGTTFEDYPSQNRQYCKTECARAEQWKGHRAIRTCEECSVEFEVAISRKNARWHSRECYDASREQSSEWSPTRFDEKIDRSSDGCWLWLGGHDVRGYGTYGGGHKRHRGLAHRRAWELATGESIPPDMVIGHACDNPGCVRNEPEGVYYVNDKAFPLFGHLWLGTDADNLADMRAKGRGRNRNGAPYQRIQQGELSFVIVAGVPIPVWTVRQYRLAPNGALTPLD